ncbi:hypothetical protein HDU67_000469 [Dinochytrium kinnereticum]|nr:hypothetical protein HDU67_000469 [Dinochytrium kinnereticum]
MYRAALTILLVASTASLASAQGPLPTSSCGDGICPAIYAPVCASNGQTYGNECELVQATCGNPGISKVKDGSCLPGECADIVCPAILAPVCGSDGKSYTSDCELSRYACADITITKVSDGYCSNSSSVSVDPITITTLPQTTGASTTTTTATVPTTTSKPIGTTSLPGSNNNSGAFGLTGRSTLELATFAIGGILAAAIAFA